MHFWFKLFCLTLIFNNITMDPREFEFNFETTGHSGFYITWEEKQMTNTYCPKLVFKFGHRIKDDPKDGNFSFGGWQYCNLIWRRHKISLLRENTLYDIIIQQYSPNEIIKLGQSLPEKLRPEKEYTFVKKTNTKTNEKPAKPNFYYYFVNVLNNLTVVEIIWIPCKGKKNCNGKEPGSHFAVKSKALDRRGEFMKKAFNTYLIRIYMMAGILYEVTVLSVYNDIYTESDPQEIFIEPDFGAVRSVKVVSYPNASILVTWKPPKYLHEKLYMYRIIIANDSSYINNYLSYFERYDAQSFPEINFINARSEKLLFDKPKYQLIPGVTYVFSIVPYGIYKTGLETQVKYTLPVKKDD